MSADDAHTPPVASVDEREGSEFGSGIVVCLAKFSEHLWNEHYDRIRHSAWWEKLTEDEREKQREEARRFPVGDAARRIADLSFFIASSRTPSEAISHQIEMWMNGASDHFYDLDERAPEPLKALASLALRIGHGFTGETWTMEHVERIRDLWEKSCLAVDAMLGVEADWGSW